MMTKSPGRDRPQSPALLQTIGEPRPVAPRPRLAGPEGAT